MNVITGRRDALRTLALTAATSAIGLAWVRAEPATATVEPRGDASRCYPP